MGPVHREFYLLHRAELCQCHHCRCAPPAERYPKTHHPAGADDGRDLRGGGPGIYIIMWAASTACHLLCIPVFVADDLGRHGG